METINKGGMAGGQLCGVELFLGGFAGFSTWLRGRALSGERAFIATPNPEILLIALEDPAFATTLASFDVRLPDGFGISLVSFVLGRGFVPRVSGVDVVPLMVEIAREKGWTVVMVGGDTPAGSCAGAAARFASDFPGVKIVQFPEVNINIAAPMPDTVAEALSLSGPCIVLAGLGMRKQEEWILGQVAGFPDVRMAIGCGGAFAMIAGTLPRAPKWMRRVGLEWLWRLVLEPRRIGRILNAVFVFPVRAIVYEIFKNR